MNTRTLLFKALLVGLLALTACTTSTTVLVSPDGATHAPDGGCGQGTDAGPTALPACTGTLRDTTGAFGPYVDGPIGTVRATGEVTFTQEDFYDGTTPIDLDATLSAVDAAALTLTLTLTTTSGTTTVALVGIPAEWLAAVPTGGAVHAHFERGLVLTDAASGRLLLALRTRSGNAVEIGSGLDVGPLHFTQGSPRCIYTWAGFGHGGPETCYIGMVATGLVAQGASVDATEQISVDGHTYFARAVQSMRQAEFDEVIAATGGAACAPALQASLSVAVVAAD